MFPLFSHIQIFEVGVSVYSMSSNKNKGVSALIYNAAKLKWLSVISDGNQSILDRCDAICSHFASELAKIHPPNMSSEDESEELKSIPLEDWMTEHTSASFVELCKKSIELFDECSGCSIAIVQPFSASKSKLSDPYTKDGYDFYLNIAGPVRSLSYAPQVILGSARYLAVGPAQMGWPKLPEEEEISADTLRFDITTNGKFGIGSDYIRILSKPNRHSNLVQLWCIPEAIPCSEIVQSKASNTKVSKKKGRTKTETFEWIYLTDAVEAEREAENVDEFNGNENIFDINHSAANATPYLAYCVEISEHGSIQSVQWCPIEITRHLTFLSSSSIGLLGIVCEDSVCLILKMPMEFDKQTISKIPVYAQDTICTHIIHCADYSGIRSMTWDQEVPMRVYCGMMDGSVTEWNLDFKLLFKRNGDEPEVLRIPSRRYCDANTDTITASALSCVNSIQMCPYDNQLFLTADNRADVKVTSLLNRLH